MKKKWVVFHSVLFKQNFLSLFIYEQVPGLYNIRHDEY